ncbi:transposase [Bacillus sp. BGMRC 2118]|nr:transposase [Bacillus sp. BGMRC 2118]
MPRRARLKSRSKIYHVIWRGANRQEIFHDDEDHMRFLDTIDRYRLESEATIYAWCLMSNHVHLLVREGNEDISATMKRIGVSYVSYYNLKYRTTGHLFQDRFRSENVESKRYFLTVIRYIHQNPTKAGIVVNSEDWIWSSCAGYYGNAIYPPKMLDCDLAFSQFSEDTDTARTRFIEFNKTINNDRCLEGEPFQRRRISDEEARGEIKKLLGEMEIAQVKSLPRLRRNEILREVKQIKGISQRQAARILGVSVNLIFKA